jgi:high-affinity iron transporter
VNVKPFLTSILFCLLLITGSVAHAAASDADNQLISVASDALVNAGGNDWPRVSADVAEMKKLWATATDTSAKGTEVSAALKKAEEALIKKPQNRDEAYQAVSALAKTVDEYVTSHQSGGEQAKAHDKVKALVPSMKQSLAAVEAGDFAKAKQSFDRFNTGWKQAEGPLRNENFTFYGKVEAKISTTRIALNTEPPNVEKAKSGLQDLITALESYAAGNVQADSAPASTSSSIADIQVLLKQVQEDVEAKKAGDAADKMDRVITDWPSVEGEVITRSQDAYQRIETKMTAIPSLILSATPDLAKASQLLGELQIELEPYVNATSYTAWDAGLILFREGLEAILIITALLAFLGRSGNADKKKWVWTGAGTGIAGSVLLAIALSALLTKATAGSSRELIEGYTGLIAVLFMLTVGAWLHKKSNLRAWNQFIEKTMGAVLERGAVWALAATAGLSVLREGAETFIFYMGMAPSMESSQLVLGIVGALVVLAVIGFVIMRLSSRIPVRPFFLVATLLLYYLAFKFIGISVHALQVAGQLPAHLSESLIQAPSFGIYSTWETSMPQLVVLLVIVWNLIRTERKNKRMVNPAQHTVK